SCGRDLRRETGTRPGLAARPPPVDARTPGRSGASGTLRGGAACYRAPALLVRGRRWAAIGRRGAARALTAQRGLGCPEGVFRHGTLDHRRCTLELRLARAQRYANSVR